MEWQREGKDLEDHPWSGCEGVAVEHEVPKVGGQHVLECCARILECEDGLAVAANSETWAV